MTDHVGLRRALAGPSVVATFLLLVVPLAVGALDTRLMTPLALPGYLILTLGSAVGNLLFSNFALWVYWAPFLVVSYVLSVSVGSLYRTVVGR